MFWWGGLTLLTFINRQFSLAAEEAKKCHLHLLGPRAPLPDRKTFDRLSSHEYVAARHTSCKHISLLCLQGCQDDPSTTLCFVLNLCPKALANHTGSILLWGQGAKAMTWKRPEQGYQLHQGCWGILMRESEPQPIVNSTVNVNPTPRNHFCGASALLCFLLQSFLCGFFFFPKKKF